MTHKMSTPAYSAYSYLIPDQNVLAGFDAPQWNVERFDDSARIKILDYYCNSVASDLFKPFEGSYCFDSAAASRADLEDGINIASGNKYEIPTTNEVSYTVAYNTRESDINNANERFLAYLENVSQIFVQELAWTDFEDGMENDVIRQVSRYIKINRYVTLCWLSKIFSNNRSQPSITSGILRTLAMVVTGNDIDYMMPVVTAGLSSTHLEDQEAAIMVVEKWRTRTCLEALLNTTYGSEWMNEYAMQVAKELKGELGV